MSKKKNRSALVTGATGFVGSRLTWRLVQDGWLVHVITRPTSDLDQLNPVKNQIVIHEHNGTTAQMIFICEKSQPEVVFHFASLFIAEHRPVDIEPLIRSNLLFGTQLLEGMAKAGLSNIINTGTSWQNYENEDYNPVNLYAATKQAFVDIIKYYVQVHSLKVITLKLFDTYGPNDPRKKLFALLRRVAEEQTELAMSYGEQLIDIVYIDDVIASYIIAAKRLLNGYVSSMEEFAISSGNPIALKKLVGVYGQTIEKPLPIEWGGRPYRSREVLTPWDRGVDLPGWKSEIGLVEGIKRMENIKESAKPE